MPYFTVEVRLDGTFQIEGVPAVNAQQAAAKVEERLRKVSVDDTYVKAERAYPKSWRRS